MVINLHVIKEKAKQIHIETYETLLELIDKEQENPRRQAFSKFCLGAYYYFGFGNIERNENKAFELAMLLNNRVQKESQKEKTNEKKENVSITDVIDMVKKVDLNSVQKNITNISKALGIVQSLITKDEVNTTESYTPRPLYKKFED